MMRIRLRGPISGTQLRRVDLSALVSAVILCVDGRPVPQVACVSRPLPPTRRRMEREPGEKPFWEVQP
jgi:hypothetical protein